MQAKRFLAALLCLLVLAGGAPTAGLAGVAGVFSASAATGTYSGDCGAQGDNVQWTLDIGTGKLTITGIGMMRDFYYYFDDDYDNDEYYYFVPWDAYRLSVKSVTIGSGVTSIGNWAFIGCSNLTGATIPNSVTHIGEGAFAYCVNLSNVTIPNSVTHIGEGAFLLCTSLTSVTIPNSVTTIDESAFAYCIHLANVTIGSGVTIICDGAFNMHLDREERMELQQAYDEAILTGETEVVELLPLNTAKALLDHPNSSLTDVYYQGTSAKWKTIRIGGDNEDLTNATLHCIGDVPPTVAIKSFTPNKTVDYRATVTFTAVVTNPVDGASVHWFIDGKDAGTGETYTKKEATKDYTVQVKYMQGSQVLAETGTETVKVNSGFFAKLIAFFRGLFGLLPKITQTYLGAERVLP